MADFVRVFGDDPHYKGRETFFYIATSTIARVCPVWAVEKDGTFFRCTDDHKDGKVVSCDIETLNGDVYKCGDIEELSVLLRKEEVSQMFGRPPREKGSLGFVYVKDAPKPTSKVSLQPLLSR